MPDVELFDLEIAWRAWCLMEIVSWQHLPRAGGLLDQPEALWDDILDIARTVGQVRRAKKGD